MQVILIQDVNNLGGINELVTVKNGYGRNYLIPQKFAIEANPSNLKKLQERIKQQNGAPFVEGLVAVAALGGLHTGGTPRSALARRDVVARGTPPLLRRHESAVGEARPSRVPVVDDDSAATRVGMQLRRDTTDIPSVACGDKWHEPDGRVLRGVSRTA